LESTKKLIFNYGADWRMVGDLEEHLGVRLIQRTTQKLALMQSGEEYLSKVREILSALDSAHEHVNDLSQELSGIIKISSPPMLSAHVLAPQVDLPFMQLFQAVNLFQTGRVYSWISSLKKFAEIYLRWCHSLRAK
jgi:hypothetical protein